MIFPALATLVPHSGPMLLLDRVVAADAEMLCAEVTIRADSQFCDGREVGAWVGIEYMAQAIAAHAGYSAQLRGEPVKPGFLLGSRRYHSDVPGFAVGAVLTVRVQRALQGDNGLGAFDCSIAQQGIDAVLASALVTVFQPPNVNEFLQRSGTE